MEFELNWLKKIVLLHWGKSWIQFISRVRGCYEQKKKGAKYVRKKQNTIRNQIKFSTTVKRGGKFKSLLYGETALV